MKLFFTFIFGLLLSTTVFSQTVILDEEPQEDSTENKMGKNRKHHVSWTVGGGFFASENEGTPTIDNYLWRSGESFVNVFYKRKWNEYLSSIVSLDYVAVRAGERRNSDTLRNEIIGHFMGLGIHQRFNFKPRGDQYGFYVEIGANGEYRVGETKRIVNRQADGEETYRRKDSRIRGTQYFNDLNYNLMAKVGYNGLSLYGRYRMMPIIREELQYDYPKITAGIIWDLSF